MAKDGAAKPSLSERLRQKASEESSEIEAAMGAELQRLGASMTARSNSVLGSIESDMESRLRRLSGELDRAERRQRLTPLWTALGSIAIVLSGLLLLWTTSEWLRWDIRSSREELARLQLQKASEANALARLIEQTGGVRIEDYGTAGTFVELPANTETRGFYRCREEQVPCVKLPLVPTIPVPRPRPDGV